METSTQEVSRFTFHELIKDSTDRQTQVIDKNAKADQIELIKGYLLGSLRDFVFQARRDRTTPSSWNLFCLTYPNTEIGLLMRCKGAARLSCYFYSNEGLTVLAKNVILSKALDFEGMIYRYTLRSDETQQVDQASASALIDHCRSPSNRVSVSISSTPLLSARVLFDALRRSPECSSRSLAETVYSQDGWDLYLKSSVDEEDGSDSASKLVRAHRGVLEKYDYFKTMFESGMLESKALERSPPLQKEQEPDLPHAPKRRRASLESEPGLRSLNCDNSTLPVIVLDLDRETLRSVVKFIYTSSIELYASHVLSPETEKPATGCEAKAAWAAADRYGITELKSAATRFIIKNLSVDTVLSDLVLSQGSEELKILYKAYIKLNLAKVKASGSVVEVLKELAENSYPSSSGELLAEVLQAMTPDE